MGHGAYGVVISANDSMTSKQVAIKKIGNAFADTVDAKRILREIKLMKRFSHENIVGIIDLIPPSGKTEEFEDIYIVQVETKKHMFSDTYKVAVNHISNFRT